MPEFNNFEDMSKHIKEEEEPIVPKEDTSKKEEMGKFFEENLPSLEELDEVLDKSDEALKLGENVDDLIERRQDNLDSARELDIEKEGKIREIYGNFSLDEIKESFGESDYQVLVKEGILSEKYSDKLEKLDEKIESLRKIKNAPSHIEEKLEELLTLKGEIQKQVKEKIEEEQEELEEKKTEVMNSYKEKIDEYNETIAQIESDPNVIEKLKKMAKEGMEEDKEIKRNKELISVFIESLRAKHENSFNRLNDILEIDDSKNYLPEKFQELKKKSEKSFNVFFSQLREKLIKNILEEDGENHLKDPEEVVPWQEGKYTKVPYKRAMNVLEQNEAFKETIAAAARKGDQEAVDLISEKEKILRENEVLRKLFGSKYVLDRKTRKPIVDKKTGKKKKHKFYQAFEERKEEEQREMKKEIKKSSEEKKDNQEEIKEIVNEGGFEVSVPFFKKVKGTDKFIGEKRGAILLEESTSKNGNECLEVVKLGGAAKELGLKIGFKSPKDGRTLPRCIREKLTNI